MRRYAVRSALVVFVVAMHGLLLGFLRIASQPRMPVASDAHRIAVHLIPVVPPDPPATQAPVPNSSRQAPMARAPVIRSRAGPNVEPTAQRDAPGIAATEPAASATLAPSATLRERPLDLHSEATRRALRDVDRNRPRSFAEQSDIALGNAPRASADTRLGASIATARRGDCQRGEFKPWAVDVGLGPEYKLPLPGVVRALAEGECAALNR